jgi:oleate hydratase
MPYITSQFLTRIWGDRPAVIPFGSTNLAFIGQFVEIEEDVVFTVEYSVRSAQIAVYGLMGLEKQPTKMYHGDRHLTVLANALKAMLEDGIRWGGGGKKTGEVCLVTSK